MTAVRRRSRRSAGRQPAKILEIFIAGVRQQAGSLCDGPFPYGGASWL